MDFYFNSAQITGPVEGSVTAGIFSVSEATNHPGVLIDKDLRLTTNFTGTGLKGIRFAGESIRPVYFSDLDVLFSSIGDKFSNLSIAGTASADYLIIHRKDVNNNPQVEVWSSEESITGYTKIFDDIIESGNKFSINSITASSAKYFVIQFKGTYNIDVSEFILAEAVQDLIHYDTKAKRNIPNIFYTGNRGGDEITNKIDEMKQRVLLNWELIEQTDADKIESLIDGVFNNAQQFVSVDGSERNWDRLAVKPELIDRGYKAYSTQLDLLRSFA